MAMRIRRDISWTHLIDDFPVNANELIGLPNEILLNDIIGAEIPFEEGMTPRKAYDILKAQGEIFLDGQIFMNLLYKGLTKRTPLWKNPEFSCSSYAVFAGVLVDYNTVICGRQQGFPTLYCDQDMPMSVMLGLDEPFFDMAYPAHLQKSYFAVRKRG